METSTYTARIIKPSEGKYLTQAGEVEITERIITDSEIWLAVNDAPENYIEISAEQAQEYLQQQEQEARRREDEMREGEG